MNNNGKDYLSEVKNKVIMVSGKMITLCESDYMEEVKKILSFLLASSTNKKEYLTYLLNLSLSEFCSLDEEFQKKYREFIFNLNNGDISSLSVNEKSAYIGYMFSFYVNNGVDFSADEKAKYKDFMFSLSSTDVERLLPSERVAYIAYMFGLQSDDIKSISNKARVNFFENIVNLAGGVNLNLTLPDIEWLIINFDLNALKEFPSLESVSYARYLVNLVNEKLLSDEVKERYIKIKYKLEEYKDLSSRLDEAFVEILESITFDDFKKLASSSRVSYIKYILSSGGFDFLSSDEQTIFRKCFFELGHKELKKIPIELQAKYMQHLLSCLRKREIGAEELELVNSYILAASSEINNFLSKEEQEECSSLLQSILGTRKYTNITPFAEFAPALKKCMVQVCKAASKLFASKELDITTMGVKTEAEDGKLVYKEVDVNEVVPKGKAFFVASHQWVLDNLMVVITNPKHAVILHNKDASALLRGIQWPTGLNEVDRDNSESRINSKYDIGSGLVKEKRELLTVAFIEATWNRSFNKLLLGLYAGSLELIKKIGIPIPIVPVVFHYVYKEEDGEQKIVKAYAVYGEPIYINRDSRIFPKKNCKSDEYEESVIEKIESQLASLKYHAMLKDRITVRFDYNYLIEEYKERGINLSEDAAKKICESLVVKAGKSHIVNGDEYDIYTSISDPDYIRQEYNAYGIELSDEDIEKIVFNRTVKIREIKSEIVKEYADYLRATNPDFAGGNVGESETTKYTRGNGNDVIPPNESPVVRKEMPDNSYVYEIGKTDAQKFIDGELMPVSLNKMVTRTNLDPVAEPVFLSSCTPDVVARENLVGTFVEYRSQYIGASDEYYSKAQGLVVGVVDNSPKVAGSSDEYLMVVLNNAGEKVYVSQQDLTIVTSDDFKAEGELSALETKKQSCWSPTGEYSVYKVEDAKVLNTPKYKKDEFVWTKYNGELTKLKIVDVEVRHGVIIYEVTTTNSGDTVYLDESKIFSDINSCADARAAKYNWDVGDVIYKRSTTCGIPDKKFTVKMRKIDNQGRICYLLWDGALGFEMFEDDIEGINRVVGPSLSKRLVTK